MGSLDNDNKFLNAISSKTSLSSTTMTTTISKHDLQHQQQQKDTTEYNTCLNAKTTITACLDSVTTNLQQIDKINNNGAAIGKYSNNTVAAQLHDIQHDNNNDDHNELDIEQAKLPKRRSLLNFKSLDYHIKHIYAGLRGNGRRNSCTQSIGSTAAITPATANAMSSATAKESVDSVAAMPVYNRMPPYLKIEAVDSEESANLLLDYTQSPYTSRRNSSHDDNRSSTQLLQIAASRSQGSSPATRYFLSPYAMDSAQNVRRSSTSDIASCKRSGNSSTSDSRRPSTSDLLRKARERRGSEARMGRSVSHSGLTRGGFRGGGAGRRTSMAF